MARIPWKENKVLSIETRPGHFVLAQMVKDPYLMVYHLFRDDQDWIDVDLQKVPVLFCHAVTNQFLSHSNITVQKIAPVIYDKIPNVWIQTSGDSRMVTVWKGTPDEIKFLIIGEGGRLVEESIAKNGEYKEKVIMPKISPKDNKTIDAYELQDVSIYAEFNERLYLCSKFNKNVDPMKDIIFNRDIPLDYKAYVGIISDTITKKEWLALRG